MTTVGRLIFGILIVLVLVGLWAVAQAIGASFGAGSLPEFLVR